MTIKTRRFLLDTLVEILTTSRKRITNDIKSPVKRIEKTGVKYFEWILAKGCGINKSLAIAKGNLEDAKTPEFAPDISVRTPTTAAKYPK